MLNKRPRATERERKCKVEEEEDRKKKKRKVPGEVDEASESVGHEKGKKKNERCLVEAPVRE